VLPKLFFQKRIETLMNNENIFVAFSGITPATGASPLVFGQVSPKFACAPRSTSCHHKFEGLLEKRRLSSNTRMAYDIDQSAMQDLISTPPRGASLGSLETLVFVLATAQQARIRYRERERMNKAARHGLVFNSKIDLSITQRMPQGGAEQMVLLSTLCPHTKLYTITLPFAQMRGHEDSGLYLCVWGMGEG
jgi:hypothetical protein